MSELLRAARRSLCRGERYTTRPQRQPTRTSVPAQARPQKIGSIKLRAALVLIPAVSLAHPSVAKAELELPTSDELLQAMASLCSLKPTVDAADSWLNRQATKDPELLKRMMLDPAWKAAEIERMMAEGQRFLDRAKAPTRVYRETKVLNRWTLEDYSAERGGIVAGTGRVYRASCDEAVERLASMGIYARCDDTPLPHDGRPLRNAPRQSVIISARYPGQLGVAGLVLPMSPVEATQRLAAPTLQNDGVVLHTGAEFKYRITGCSTEQTQIRPKSSLSATIVDAEHFHIERRGRRPEAIWTTKSAEARPTK